MNKNKKYHRRILSEARRQKFRRFLGYAYECSRIIYLLETYTSSNFLS